MYTKNILQEYKCNIYLHDNVMKWLNSMIKIFITQYEYLLFNIHWFFLLIATFASFKVSVFYNELFLQFLKEQWLKKSWANKMINKAILRPFS